MLRPWLCFANFVNAEDDTTPITDKHFSGAIEGQAGRDAKATGKCDHLTLSRNAIDCAVKPAGHEHSTRSAERDSRRVHHVAGKIFHRRVAADAENRNGNVLSTRA